MSGASASEVRRAREIAAPSLVECVELEREEVRRLSALVRSLSHTDWEHPTSRGGRTVRERVASLTGGYVAQAKLVSGMRDLDPRLLRMFRSPGEPLPETIARARAGQRWGASPEALVRELEVASERALDRRLLVARSLSVVPADRFMTLGKLLRPMHPLQAVHDLWLLRIDLARVTGKAISFALEQDGRVLETMIRPRAGLIDPALTDHGVDLRILEGACWRFGAGSVAETTVDVPFVEFVKLLRGERSAEATRERSAVIGSARAATNLFRTLHGSAVR